MQTLSSKPAMQKARGAGVPSFAPSARSIYCGNTERKAIEIMNNNGYTSKIVVIGGGSGSSTILRGLKPYPVDLTAIVTMFDSGGSTGILRQEFGYPPFGDLRQCLLALGDDTKETQVIRQALEFRFGQKTSLNGHSLGNLLMAALTSLNDNLEQSIEDLGRALHTTGRVIPVTFGQAELCAELKNGHIIRGETEIDLRLTPLPSIKHIFLDGEVKANPKAIQAIMEADAIVLGPGDLYTSILPNLLVEGMVEALSSTKATRIYMCNLMTKLAETDRFKASNFVREILSYLEPAKLDWAIINTSTPSESIRQTYEEEGARVVGPEIEKVTKLVDGVIATSLASIDLPLRHDSDLTASAILQVLNTGRVAQYPTEHENSTLTLLSAELD